MRNTRRAFNEFGNLLSSDDRRVGQQTLSRADEAMRSEDTNEIQQAIDLVQLLANDLTSVMMNMPGEEKKA